MLHRIVLSFWIVLPAALMGCEPSPPSTESAGAGASGTEPSAPTPTSTPTAETVESPQTKGNAKLGLERFEHDFGEIWDLEKQETTFGFENKGKGPLIIEEVKASCGCTTPTLTKTTYLPGEKGTLEIAFAPKGNGRQTKTLTVRCNDPERPVTILKISSTIKPFVKPDPLYLRYEEVSKGESKQLTLDLQCVDPNFEILDFGIRGTAARYFKVEQDSFRPTQLSVTFLGNAPWGPHYGNVFVKTRGVLPSGTPVEKEIQCTASVTVLGSIRPSDTMFRVGATAPKKPFQKQITLTADKPFSILSASITGARRDGPTMSLNFAPVSGDGNVWQVQLTGDPGDYLGALSALAVIETDLPDESQLKFRIAGMVRELGK